MLGSFTGCSGESDSIFVDGISSFAACDEELASECIKIWQSACQVVQAATNRAMSTTFLVEVFDKGSFVTVSFVGFTLFIILGEEFDGGI